MKKFLIFLVVFSFLIAIRIVFFAEGSIKVALIQMKIKYSDRKFNTDRAIDMIEKAAEENIKIACLPEAFDIGWVNEKAGEFAEEIPGTTSEKLSECARKNKIYIIATGTEKAGAQVFNTAYIINKKGEIIYKQRKLNIANIGMRSEVKIYDEGSVEDVSVVETEFGKIGLAVSSDIIYNKIDILQKISDSGAWLVFVPSGWISSIDPSGENAQKVASYMEEVFLKESTDKKLTLVGINSAETLYNGRYLRNSEFIGHSIVVCREKGLIGTGHDRQEEIVIVDLKY